MESLKVAIIGLGNRGLCYGELSLLKPKKMKVVQIVDFNKTALEYARKLYNVPEECCYSSFEEFLNAPKIAEAVINCTMDQYHIETTMPIFKKGYDVLLEKPICNDTKELVELMNESKKYDKKLMICHVLRYTPFYRTIKKIINSGELGNLITIEAAEHVYIPHMLASYIRGKWRSEKECGSAMMMAKCCHDTDLLCWLNSGNKPDEVSSFGSRSTFVPANKPTDAADKCFDCKYKETCIYSCFQNIKNKHMDPIIFNNAVAGKRYDELTDDEKIKVLKESPSLGYCAFSGPQDLVDHQSTIVKFENGVTCALTMTGGTSYPCRTMQVILTKGEIYGTFEFSKVHVRKYIHDKFKVENKTIYLGDVGNGHGGGDIRLVEDFVDYVRTGKKSISLTEIEDSIDGHLVGIGADISDKNNKTVRISKERELKY